MHVGKNVHDNPQTKQIIETVALYHRLRPIDTHLALYTMLYNNSAKNRYAEPVRNKNKANIGNQGLICPLFLNTVCPGSSGLQKKKDMLNQFVTKTKQISEIRD